MENIKYEAAVAELEQILSQMESGQLDLDALTSKLKRAQELISLCKDRLTKTDEEIQNILKEQ